MLDLWEYKEEVFRKYVEKLTETELECLMRAIETRYRNDFPDWEVFYVALEKNGNRSREEQIRLICDFHKKYDTKPE